jgi:ABC-type transport system involved in cytochrome c biogenesis permease subunit
VGVAAYAAAAVVQYARAAAVPALTAAAVAALGWAIAERWRQVGHGPFMTLYEVLLSNLFSLGLVFLVVYAAAPRTRAAGVVVLPVLVLLGAWTLGLPADPVPLPPTFDNPRRWAHVVTGKLFLGVLLVATALAAVLLARRLWPGRWPVPVSLPEALEPGLWRLLAVAFVFDSAMLLAGAVWAHDAWGRYWAWDPLETWAFVTWLALGLVLHARLTLRLPPWAGWLAVIGVFVLAFLTFFGVPFLSLAPHKGVM